MWWLFFVKKEKNIFICILFLPLIHASFTLIVAIYIVYILMRERISNIFYLSFFLSLILLLFFNVALIVATYLGLYQISYIKDYELNASGFSFVFYVFIYFSLLYTCRFEGNKIFDLAIIFTAIYLSLYFFTPLIGRYMVTFFPFILLSLVMKSRIENYVILFLLILVYSVVSYSGAIFENSLLISSFSEMKWN